MATTTEQKTIEDTIIEVTEQLKLDGVDVPPLEELKLVFLSRNKITDRKQWMEDDVELEAVIIHDKAVPHNHHTNKLRQNCVRCFLCQDDTAIKRVYVSLNKLYEEDSCYSILKLSDKLAEEITVGAKGIFIAMLAEEADSLSEDNIVAATCGYIVLGEKPCSKPETWVDAKTKEFYAYIPFLQKCVKVHVYGEHCLIDNDFYRIIRLHANVKKIMKVHDWEVV